MAGQVDNELVEFLARLKGMPPFSDNPAKIAELEALRSAYQVRPHGDPRPSRGHSQARRALDVIQPAACGGLLCALFLLVGCDEQRWG